MSVGEFKGTILCGMSDPKISSVGTKIPSKSAEQKLHSNNQRLKSMRERFSSNKNQKQFVSDALKRVDASAPNKKIRFEDDFDGPPEVANGAVKNGKKSLFDSDSENEEIDVSNSFHKPQHSGKSGQKLMELEAKFGGDKRFKLDEKFIENENEIEEKPDERAVQKTKEFDILTKVLGKEVKQTVKSVSKFGPIVRFDPTNPEHQKYEVKRTERDGSESELFDSDEKPENEALKVSQERFFKVDTEFAENLRKRSAAQEEPKEGFSLLASLGRKPTEEKTETDVKGSGNKKKLEEDDFKWFKSDTDSSHPSASLPKFQPDSGPKTSDHRLFLFLPENDKRLTDAVKSFRRTQSIDAIRKRWDKFRPSLIKGFKARRKDALRKQKQERTAKWTRTNNNKKAANSSSNKRKFSDTDKSALDES